MPIVMTTSLTYLASIKDPSLYLISGLFMLMKTMEFAIRRTLDEMIYVPLDYDSRFLVSFFYESFTIVSITINYVFCKRLYISIFCFSFLLFVFDNVNRLPSYVYLIPIFHHPYLFIIIITIREKKSLAFQDIVSENQECPQHSPY